MIFFARFLVILKEDSHLVSVVDPNLFFFPDPDPTLSLISDPDSNPDSNPDPACL